eukprot:GHVS01032537.1.p1 GENE.GHVS01032537.1~~GHVS01032537.1.p1  ORF type:complete len:492 (-),score=49.57 GHVS01032537.1:355-1830(-)
MVTSSLVAGVLALDGASSLPTNAVLHVRPGRHNHAEDLFRRIVSKTSELQETPFVASPSYHRFISLVVILFGICWGISTYFHSSNNLDGLICFFVLRLLFLLIFIVDSVLQFVAFRRITVTLFFDCFLNLVGAADVCLSCVIISNGFVGDLYQPHLALEVVQLFRLYRILFIVKELQLFSTGLFHSLQSLRWAALFVMLVIYGSAIFTTWTFGHNLSTADGEDEDDMYEMWGTLINSLFTLFTVLTLEGWNDICSQTAKHHPYCKIFFVIYICFTTLTLMNVVTGVVLDAYVETSQRMNAGKEYERLLRNNKVMESLLQTAFLVDPPLANSDKDSIPPVFRRQSTFSPSTSTMDTSPQANEMSPKNNPSMDLMPDISESSDSDVYLSTADPQAVLLRADVLRALAAGHVPLYLAFDVLRTYHLQHRSTVTVSEFCDGCSRMAGQATGRHLIHLEVSLKSQLNRLERRIRSITRRPNAAYTAKLSLPPPVAC